MFEKETDAFIEELESVPWFEHCGTPNEKYHMVYSLYNACDGWGEQYSKVWEPCTCHLEDLACKAMGDDGIDDVFDAVSSAIGDRVWEKMGEFIKRQHLENETAVAEELFHMVKRDMAWACVERVLDKPGFFTVLLGIYREGYLPCAWTGSYPEGQAVVL